MQDKTEPSVQFLGVHYQIFKILYKYVLVKVDSLPCVVRTLTFSAAFPGVRKQKRPLIPVKCIRGTFLNANSLHNSATDPMILYPNKMIFSFAVIDKGRFELFLISFLFFCSCAHSSSFLLTQDSVLSMGWTSIWFVEKNLKKILLWRPNEPNRTIMPKMYLFI